MLSELSIKSNADNPNIIKILLILFLIASAMPFLPEALNNIIQGKNANIGFVINEPLFGVKFRYIKDIIMILLLGLIFLHDLKLSKWSPHSRTLLFYFVIALLIVCGYSVMYYQINSTNILQAAAGIRPILLFAVCYKSLQFFKGEGFIKAFSKTLVWLVVLELIIILAQYYTSSKIYGFQNPLSLRLIGTFGGISIAGYFALGASCYFFINQKQFKVTPLLQTFCMVIAGLSGTRSAMIGCSIIIAASVIRSVLLKLNRSYHKNNSLLISITSFGLIGGYFLIGLIGKLSERGSIVGAQANGGRIDFLISIFANSSATQIIFGNGLGYGTNTAVTLNREFQSGLDSKVMDGTINSILTQFGVLGMIIAGVLFFFFSVKLFRNNKGRYLDIGAILVVTLLMCITTNIFEQFTFLSLLSITYYTLQKEKQHGSIKVQHLKQPYISGKRLPLRN